KEKEKEEKENISTTTTTHTALGDNGRGVGISTLNLSNVIPNGRDILGTVSRISSLTSLALFGMPIKPKDLSALKSEHPLSPFFLSFVFSIYISYIYTYIYRASLS